MRYVILLLVLLVGCGGGSGSESDSKLAPAGKGGKKAPSCAEAPVVGEWTQVFNGYLLDFNSDCTGGDGSKCFHVFDYGFSDTELFLEVLDTDGADGCLPMGEVTCTYEFTTTHPDFIGEELLGITCGETTEYFRRQ